MLEGGVLLETCVYPRCSYAKMQSMQLYTSNDLHSVKLPKIWLLASTVSKIFLFCDLFFAKVFIHEIVYKNINGMNDPVFTHSISTTNCMGCLQDTGTCLLAL